MKQVCLLVLLRCFSPFPSLSNLLSSVVTAFSSYTNSYKEQSESLQLQIEETANSACKLEKRNADLAASIAKLEAEAQEKLGNMLLDQDRAHSKKQQLFKLKVVLSKLKVDAAELEKRATRDDQECKSLEKEENCSKMQREDLLASLSVIQAQISDYKQASIANKNKLKSAGEISGVKLRALGISTRPNQQLKNVIKTVDQFCVSGQLLGSKSCLLCSVLTRCNAGQPGSSK